MYCNWCGAENEAGALFCTECGASLPEETVQRVVIPKKRMGIKIIAGVVAAVVLVGVVAMGYKFIPKTTSVMSSSYEDHPVVYVKDDRVYLKDGKKDAVVIADGYGYFEADTYDAMYTEGFDCFSMSADGETMFFIDDFENAEYKLYYRTRNYNEKTGEPGVKIASGVHHHEITPDGKKVIYMKNDRIYVSDLTESKNIASDVVSFNLSADGNRITYYKGYGDLYLCDLRYEDGVEKIDTEVYDVLCSDENYEKIYYRKEDGSIYLKEVGKEKVKVLGDGGNVFRIGEDYYITKYVDKYLEFEDIFIDDFTNDAEITEPDRFDFAEEQIYGNVVIDYDAYHEAQAEYEAKYIRDEIREYFSENPEMATSQNLYKLDGTELIEISTGVYAEEYFQDRIIQKIVGYEKIKLSEVEDLNDAKMKAYDCTRYPKREYYMLKKDGTLILLEDYAVDPFRQGKISEDEKYIYCLEDYSAGSGTFIRYTLTESGLSERKVLYEDVEEVTKYGECTVVYLEDEIVGVLENDGYTELGENLGDRLIRKNDVLFYCDEISEINGVGNLNRYKDGKVSEIDIDVFEFIPRSEDVCYYIADYSSNSQIGELYRYKNGEKEKIDSDVSFIVY